jgi:nitrogen fixation NifU-like protein
MSAIRDIYQEMILDHGRRPRNRRAMEGTGNRAEGNNPLCGDRVTVYVSLDGETIRDVSFVGEGCAISLASASVMTEILKGKTLEEADTLFTGFHAMLTGNGSSAGTSEGIGKLEAFRGVRDFPVRVKCATLAWHTMKAAVAASGKAVTTE